jgi:hypothetical protein
MRRSRRKIQHPAAIVAACAVVGLVATAMMPDYTG